MAKARKETINEERVVVTPVDRVILELTHEEAQFLYDIVGWGVTGVGRREKYNGDIFYALGSLGLFSGYHPGDFTGSVRFA